MSWRDREYARSQGDSSGPVFRGGRLLGGSVVTTLIAINVAVFVLGLSPTLHAWMHGVDVERFPHGYQHLPGFFELVGARVLRGEVWRLFSAQYLHAYTGHIFLNMLGLHFLGRPLERMWSPRKFFTLYTICGLAGNLFFTILSARGVINPYSPAVGASGCIYGLLGIVAVLFPTATVYVYLLFPIRIRTAAAIFGAIALVTILERGANYGGEACHLAGLVFGVWWAMRGEAWWGRRSGGRRSHRGRRRIRDAMPGFLRPSKFAEKIAERRIEQHEVDRILKKVYEQGVFQLTEEEKRTLQHATEQQRLRDAQMGRTDRL